MRAALRGRDAAATSFPLVSSDRGDRGRALRKRRSRRYENREATCTRDAK